MNEVLVVCKRQLENNTSFWNHHGQFLKFREYSSFKVWSKAIPRSNVRVTPGVVGMSKMELMIVFEFDEVRYDINVLQ